MLTGDYLAVNNTVPADALPHARVERVVERGSGKPERFERSGGSFVWHRCR